MFFKQLDMISIGDITTDAFIKLRDAHIHCKLNHTDCELCMRFGAKVPFDEVKIIHGVGNAANVSVCSSRMGLNSAIVTNIGKDQNGKECLKVLQKEKVITKYVAEHNDKPTNYHFVLWYGSDRTILVNHIEYDHSLPKFPEPKWIYLTSIGDGHLGYVTEIIHYLELHPKVKLAFQPGTFQLNSDFKSFEKIYSKTEILLLNLEEAELLTIKSGKGGPNHKTDPKSLLKILHNLGPKIVVITNGPHGAYMSDGDHNYFMPIYPDPKPPLERTGCGDAWSATFVSGLILGKTPLESLLLAPINSMSVAQYVGAQQGLLRLDQMDWWLGRASEDYRPREI